MQTQREDGHMNMNTGNEVMLPQAKNCWQPPEARTGKEGCFLGAFTGNTARLTLDSDS